MRPPINVLIGDRRSGVYAIEIPGRMGEDVVTHIGADGATSQVTAKLAFTCGTADPATGDLVVIGHRAPQTTLQRVAADGTSTSEVLPRPAWMQKSHVDPIPGGCAVAALVFAVVAQNKGDTALTCVQHTAFSTAGLHEAMDRRAARARGIGCARSRRADR